MNQPRKDGLKFADMGIGEQCATTYGLQWMLKWCVGNWDTPVLVGWNRSLALL